MNSKPRKRWVLEGTKPASDGYGKQLSKEWMSALAVLVATTKKLHQATGIETLLLRVPRLVRRAKEIIKAKKHTLKRVAVRERYGKPKGSVTTKRDYRIAVANAAQVYAEAVESWIVSLSGTSQRPRMTDVWQWIADQATNPSSHLSSRLRAAGQKGLADAELDRGEWWWRNQLAKTSAFLALKQRLISI